MFIPQRKWTIFDPNLQKNQRMIIKEKCYQKSPDIVFRKIADEVILVPIRNNIGDLESIYTLNEVAARIWELIDGKRQVSQMRDIILDEFDINHQDADNDLREILQNLEKAKAIKEA